MFNKIMNIGRRDRETGRAAELAALAGEKAEFYFSDRRLSCSESSLLVINRLFGGGLTDDQAMALGSGFGGGIGGSGCLCGAISGAVMAMGLFLGSGGKGAPAKKKFRKIIGAFNDRFREASGTVCCRELIADFRKDRKGRSDFCRGLTGRCTADAVGVILRERPELAMRVDRDFLESGE